MSDSEAETGLLIYRYSPDTKSGHFIQMLEGDEGPVRTLYEKIKRDKRHHTILPLAEVVSSYYLRLRVEDKPGVLADITRILADQQISIDAMIQREPEEGEEQADIIFLTHETRERNVAAAIEKIESHPAVKGKLTRLRLEGLL